MTNYQKNLIIDIGANLGEDTELYLKKGFDVIAIEPNLNVTKELKAKFEKYLKSKKLVILTVAIRNTEGKIILYSNKGQPAWSSLNASLGQRGGNFDEIEVRSKTLYKLFKEFGVPYYLKIDTEGDDSNVISTLFNSQQKPKFISTANPSTNVLDSLYESGYSLFKLINQAKIAETKCPRPSCEGNFVDYQFKEGCSGLFGEETEGEWNNYKQIVAEIKNFWNLNPKKRANIGWYDLHAKLHS